MDSLSALPVHQHLHSKPTELRPYTFPHLMKHSESCVLELCFVKYVLLLLQAPEKQNREPQCPAPAGF